MKKQRKSRTKPNDPGKLLLAVLAQVPFDGWTMTALEHGAKRAGLEKGHVQLAWPHGVRDAVAEFSVWADRRMLDAVAQDRLYVGRRTRDKVAHAAWARFETLRPHSEAMQKLCSWALLPYHAPYALQHLYATCDAVWRAAGDVSTDFNFYTKRGLLAYVLKTTTLFWLSDSSEGKGASRQFLDRRIEEVLRLGKAVNQLKDLPEHFGKLGTLADIAGFFRRRANS